MGAGDGGEALEGVVRTGEVVIVEEGDDTARGFIRKDLGEGDPRVVSDGDVEVFPTRAQVCSRS